MQAGGAVRAVVVTDGHDTRCIQISDLHQPCAPAGAPVPHRKVPIGVEHASCLAIQLTRILTFGADPWV